MRRITVFVDDGPLEGLPFECGSWDVGHAGELRIYNDDALPGRAIPGVFSSPPIMTPPKPPSLKAVFAHKKWSAVKDETNG